MEPSSNRTAALIRARGEPLLEALERHRPGSREHADGTAAYALAVAVELGRGREEAEGIRETARLHAIGQVYVPAELLERPPAKLGEAERSEREAHFEHGYQLALGAAVPEEAAGWLLRTRERFDGAGPEGLAGEAIPLASRIVRAACACERALATADAPGGEGPAGSAARGEAPGPAGETAGLVAIRRRALSTLRVGVGAELDPAVVGALESVLERATRSTTP